jgi:hypothetical protein
MSGFWIGTTIAAVGTGSTIANQTRQRKVAKKQSKEQKKLLMEQEITEKKRLNEAESEIGRRKALKQGGGRSLLMASAPQGATTIGGQ